MGRNRLNGTRVGRSSLSSKSLDDNNRDGAGVGEPKNELPFLAVSSLARPVVDKLSPAPNDDDNNRELGWSALFVKESPTDDDDEIGSVPSERANGTGGAGGGCCCLLRGLNVARSGCQMRGWLPLLLLLLLLLSSTEEGSEVEDDDDDDDDDLVGSGGGIPSNLNGGAN